MRALISDHRSPRGRRGFTLIEMMVVIGIIVLLVALTIGLVAIVNRGSETRVTENMLKIADNAYTEWKTNSERDVSYGVADQPQVGVVYEIGQAAPVIEPGLNEFIPTRRTLKIINSAPAASSILKNLHTDLLKAVATPAPNLDLKMRLVDAWDTEIIVVFPGRKWDPVFDALATKDEDGTIQTEFERAFGVCDGRRVRFVSAGPDGRFGDLSAADGTPAREAAEDNVYSYPLEAP